MRRIIAAIVISGALLAGLAAQAAAAEPPGSCEGELVSFAVQLFGGRRAVASTFFGGYPQAVQGAEWFARAYCGF